MSATYGELSFGVRAAKITPLPSGTAVTLPRIQTIEANVVSDSTDLTGNDVVVATHTFGQHVEGSVTAGGINPAAIAIMMGATAVTTGTTGDETTTIDITATTVNGYFKLEGQMIGDDGGDLHVIVWKAKVTNGPTFSWNYGEFALTQGDIYGVVDDDDKLLSLAFNEQVTAIA